jgi:hypothetical protein
MMEGTVGLEEVVSGCSSRSPQVFISLDFLDSPDEDSVNLPGHGLRNLISSTSYGGSVAHYLKQWQSKTEDL